MVSKVDRAEMKSNLSLSSSPLFAFLTLVSLVLLFGHGQSLMALDFWIDDYYFLLRSSSSATSPDRARDPARNPPDAPCRGTP